MQRSYKFIREKSSGDLKTEVITTTNVILLGGSTIAFKLSSIAALGFAAVAKSTHSKPILNMTVYEYLFGYEDIISTMGSKILPSIVAFEKFGLFDQFTKAEYNHTVTTSLKEVFEETSSTLNSENNKSREQEFFHDEMNNDLDVEYEDDSVNNDSNQLNEYKKLHVEEQNPNSSRTKKARDFSISLWNGSPFLPNWKNPSRNKFD
jgi:CD36 family